MRISAVVRPLMVAALSLFVVSTAGCAEARKSDDAFGAKVKAYLMAHPEVIQEAMEALEARRQAEETLKARKSIGEHKAELFQKAGDPTLGVGPITVVEFFDYRCSYCKAAAPRIPDLVAKHPNIRIVFKEFPILTPISRTAAAAALAAAKQGKYLPVHLGLMAEKALDEAAIDRVLKDKGVDLDRAHADMASPEIKKALEDNRELAHAVGVDGTPGFIVGDKMIGGFLEDDILNAVKAEAAGASARSGTAK
jgi:protein-disulfide isomerase